MPADREWPNAAAIEAAVSALGGERWAGQAHIALGAAAQASPVVPAAEYERLRGENEPTHICLDCGALGHAGGYHDHGGGDAGDTCSIEELRTAYLAWLDERGER